MSDTITTKKYIVTFKTIICPASKVRYDSYPVRVSAIDFNDAQAKAIDTLENLSICHGEITAIVRSW